MIKVLINIDGMHCAACSAAVERAVNKIEGVDEVSVNLTAGNALVSFNEAKAGVDEVITAVNNAGFVGSLPTENSKTEKREKAEKDTLKAKKVLVFSIIFALPLFYISMGHMFGAPLPKIIDPSYNPFNYSLIQLVLSVIVMFSGFDIYKNAAVAAVHRNLNMDTLISIGSLASFLYSIYSLIMIFNGSNEHIHQLYFESAGMIITFILIGRFLESSSKRKTNSAVEKLMDLSPSTALLIVDGKEKEVSTDSLKSGDTVAVKSGMTVPVDGVVISGNCTIDESMLTGESLPVDKSEGAEIFGGTLNTNGYIVFRVTAEVNDSAPAKIAEYVNKAQATKAPIANLANKIASVFVPVVICIATLAALLWIISGQNIAFAVKIFVCVLVIACPCSLGLATPTALTVSMGRSASNGILIKNGEALQRLNETDTVVFDKTGTITKGKPEVSDFAVYNGFTAKESLEYLGSAEAKSEHPLSKAIISYCEENNIETGEVSDCEFLTGMGIKCRKDTNEIICGNEKLMIANGVDIGICKGFAETATSKGKTAVMLSINGKIAACAAISDSLKENCVEIISKIKKIGIETVMLTGDNIKTANEIARSAGIDTVHADLMPDDKLRIVNELKDSGKKVIMVGDGINDAPSLTAADVGMAIGSGTDIAIESADIVLIGGDISGVLSAIQISKRTMRIIKQNLFWAFAYNVICIPVAAGLLFAFGGPLLSPMFAAAAMSLSSVTVVSNSLRLYKADKHS